MPWKIVLASDPLSSEALHFFKLVVRIGSGDERQYRLPPRAYLQIVAATNFKQRTRKMLEYYHADRLNYAVGGTPNRLEYDQGFFVKLGRRRRRREARRRPLQDADLRAGAAPRGDRGDLAARAHHGHL